MIKTFFKLIIVSSFIFGCSSAQIVGVRDPKFPKYSAKQFLVVVLGEDLVTRKIVENAFVDELILHEINAFKGMELLPPTRAYSKEEIQNVLQGREIDSILIFYKSRIDTSPVYLPAVTQVISSYSYDGMTTQTALTTGGHVANRVEMSGEAFLIEPKSFSVVWRASINLSGFNRARLGSFAPLIATRCADELHGEDIIPAIPINGPDAWDPSIWHRQ